MRINPHLSAAAVVLTLGATAALPTTGNATGWSLGVRPNPDEQILIASSQPRAAVLPEPRALQPNPDQQDLEATNTGHRASAGTPAVIVRISSPKSGFEWDDAGIGAAGALGLSLIVLAGVLAVSHHRARRTGSTTAIY
jgi:hypothetical protein